MIWGQVFGAFRGTLGVDREALQPLGCDHWKVNMGQRPAGGPSEEQLKRLANTLNELGAKTIAMGVRLSPHPHIWGPIEREKEMRREESARRGRGRDRYRKPPS